jgi:lipoate-protein ligase B
MTRTLDVVDLGRRRYGDVLELQRTLRLQRLAGGLTNDLLLLVEHEPVFTLGRGTLASSLPFPADALRARGADVVEIERGGDATWHGPGQLVGYPIIDLTQHRPDLHWYLRTVEQGLITALAELGVPAGRNTGRTGVWTEGRKIASIGIHVKQWVTIHGFALNVHPELGWFDLIVPCGIHGVQMTSVAREVDATSPADVLMETARVAVTSAFGSVLDRVPRRIAAVDFIAAMTEQPSRNPLPEEAGAR